MESMERAGTTPQILIVDDVDANLMILENIILEMGYKPMCASSASEATKLIAERLPQLILLDVFMPEMDGYEFCERLKENPITRDIPIIFISAADSSEDKVRGFKLGAVDYIAKPFEVTEVTMRVKNHLKLYEMQQELELSNRRLHSVIGSQARRIEEEQKNILYALAALGEEQGSGAGHHLDNVAYNCRLLAQSLQFSPGFSEEISEAFIDTIEVASRLHDIGKIQTPCRIRVAHDSFETENPEVLERHVEQGTAILEKVNASTTENSFLPMAIEIARYRYANWDGSGYPKELKGKNIPLSARITAIIDIYDDLLEGKHGQDSDKKAESLRIIEEGSGTFFDPEIVEVFLKVQKQLHHEEG